MHQLMVWPTISASCALVLAFIACWLLIWLVLRLLRMHTPRRGSTLFLALWTFAAGFAAPFAMMQIWLMPPLIYLTVTFVVKREFRTSWDRSSLGAVLAMAVALLTIKVFTDTYLLFDSFDTTGM